MKEVFGNLLGFIYSFSMGDYFFFIGTFLLIVLFIYVLYLIKLSEIEESTKTKKDKTDTFDIEAVTKAIEEDYKPDTIKLTSYEVEQEESAIISYEELVQNKDKIGINYDDEYSSDIPELSVKKINLTTDFDKIEEPKLEVRLMQYDKEEAFLKALKELQENLSH